MLRLTIEKLLRLLAEEKNGRPNYGAILQYFRHIIGWTADELAFHYSEALGLDEAAVITATWINHMENENRVPTGPKLRWILAPLLNIPPDLCKWEKVDMQEYRLTLENHCNRRE